MTEFKIADPLLRRMVYAIGIMVIITLSFYTFSLLKDFITLILTVLTPFIAALLMGYILAPVVMVLKKQFKMGRIMGTLALYLIIFMIVFLLFTFLIPKFLSEFIRLFYTLKETVPPFLLKLSQNKHLNIDEGLIKVIQNKIKDIEIDYEWIVTSLIPALKKMASGGFEAVGAATKGIFISVGSLAGFFSFLSFVGIINFYMMIDWEKIRPLIRKLVNPAYRKHLFDIMDKLDIAVGGFLRGQLTVSAIVGILFAVGLFCMGFIGFPVLRDYCIFIGTASAVGGFIPYLGAIIGVTPAILIIILTPDVPWSTKLNTLIAVLALFTLIQSIEGFILQPKIVGKEAGLHPLLVMFALIFGAQFGIGGMIVAVPLASVIRVLVREFYWIRIEQREKELGIGN